MYVALPSLVARPLSNQPDGQCGGRCTLLVVEQNLTLEDAIELHAFAPIEALPAMRVTNGIPLSIHCLLPLPP